jgi:hypothetical protein
MRGQTVEGFSRGDTLQSAQVIIDLDICQVSEPVTDNSFFNVYFSVKEAENILLIISYTEK